MTLGGGVVVVELVVVVVVVEVVELLEWWSRRVVGLVWLVEFSGWCTYVDVGGAAWRGVMLSGAAR